MTAPIKKITAFFLLLVALAPIVNLFIIPLQQQWIRHRMEEQLESGIQHEVLLAENEVRWIDNGKEMLVDGRMFDVKQIVHQGDGTLRVTGLFDDEESSLLRQLEQNQDKNNTGGNQVLVQFFGFQPGLPVTETIATDILTVNKTQRQLRDVDEILTISKKILTPPPQA